MAIKAILETGRDIPETEVMELATGERDELGKPFTVIHLMAISNDRRGGGARFHVCGFQNAYIHVMDTGIQIKYGPTDKGDCMFEKNKLGKLIGVLPKTQWNMEMLAAEELAVKEKKCERKWKIMDADIEDEIQSIIPKLKILNTAKETTTPEELLNKELDLVRKHEAIVNKEKTENTVESFAGQDKLIEELKTVGYNKLLERAKATGAWNDRIQKRDDIIKIIVAYEASKANKGDLAVE